MLPSPETTAFLVEVTCRRPCYTAPFLVAQVLAFQDLNVCKHKHNTAMYSKALACIMIRHCLSLPNNCR